MSFDFGEVLQRDGFSSLRSFDRVVDTLRALLILPLLNDRFFAHHANTRRVNIEWHIRKSLAVDFTKLGLVVVMIGGPYKSIGHPALSDVGEGTFRWFHCHGLRCVKDRYLAS